MLVGWAIASYRLLVPDSQDPTLKTIGLGGDGDEVAAILAVERHFGVALDYGDAPNWQTAGDVFASLRRALPADQRDGDNLWQTFATIICDETRAQADRVAPDNPLLALPLRDVVWRWFKRVFGSPG